MILLFFMGTAPNMLNLQARPGLAYAFLEMENLSGYIMFENLDRIFTDDHSLHLSDRSQEVTLSNA